jgi:serine/threonine protein kinase
MTSRRERVGAALSGGTVLIGKYRLERVLGEGGMGVVYAAHHLLLDRPVALKLLAPEAVQNPEAVARFLNEARNAARIDNEYVCRVMDLGVLPEGQPYIAMELLEGIDLGRLLAERGPLPQVEAVGYVIQALTGIGGAHLMGVIHRDLKPSNLFLAGKADGSRIVKVLDFGISKATRATRATDATGAAAGARVLTSVNNALGSPAYMSPEQVRSASSIDLRTDLWAVGVILYELCTGVRPFASSNVAEVLALILERDPVPLSVMRAGIPPGFEAVVSRCLHKNAEHRFASAAELAHALAPFGPWAAAGARAGPPLDGRESTPRGAAPAPAVVEPFVRTADVWTGKDRAGARASSSPYLRMVVLGAAIGIALLAVAAVVLAVRGGPREARASSTPSAAVSISSAPAASAAAAPADTASAEPPVAADAVPSSSADAPVPRPSASGAPAPLRRPPLSRHRR